MYTSYDYCLILHVEIYVPSYSFWLLLICPKFRIVKVFKTFYVQQYDLNNVCACQYYDGDL